MRQFHGFKPSAALLCYDLDEIWDAFAGLWSGFDESCDDLEGKELILTTVSRF